MAKNVLSKLNCEELIRLDVNFKIESNNLDNLIGRTAHILLMEYEPLIEILIHKYSDFFCE